ncbi:MAG: hypothetical protein CMB80_31430 [Flammeovirgaceae bacterium]|nr:hypothetical protein [Flammeovirgaceae bacterium]MBE61953.1 hypothetical protein [Flammeovirgaceae bacterium]MBR06597.1 hypothetical protein [Rickettsiales bacterium]HCX23583.1 hypothetical protein [Cytophagales bacterium]|tara:strand:+ start:525 stop:1664 length:1140 start_codon:yes stop_codon:yes gene_type:complete
MPTDSTNVLIDFKKWILFNKQLSDYQNVFDLYKAVEQRKSHGKVELLLERNELDENLIIQQENYNEALELSSENISEFLAYLKEHYLANQDIDEWFLGKTEQKDRSTNLQTGNKQAVSNVAEFHAHPKEAVYFRFRVFFSVLIYLLALVPVLTSFTVSTTQGLFGIFTVVTVVLIFALFRRFVQGLFVGTIKGHSVKLSENQFPEVYKIVVNQCKSLGIKEVPEVLVSEGHFNAFVTKLARSKYLMLYSEVLETAQRGDFKILEFVIAHELGHIKRKHLSIEGWLFPSKFIPFLSSAHSRACEYTCDRLGYHQSPQGALEGIMVLAAGKNIYSKINLKQYLEDAQMEDSFWVWFSEKFLSHPHTFKRLLAIKNYSERGY